MSYVVVNSSICLADGHTIVTASVKQLLSKFGGLTKNVLKRINNVKPRVSCTAKTQMSDPKFEALKTGYFDRIVPAVDKHDIPSESISNWDRSGINVVSIWNLTIAVEDSKTVPIVDLWTKFKYPCFFFRKSCIYMALRPLCSVFMFDLQ